MKNIIEIKTMIKMVVTNSESWKALVGAILGTKLIDWLAKRKIKKAIEIILKYETISNDRIVTSNKKNIMIENI